MFKFAIVLCMLLNFAERTDTCSSLKLSRDWSMIKTLQSAVTALSTQNTAYIFDSTAECASDVDWMLDVRYTQLKTYNISSLKMTLTLNQALRDVNSRREQLVVIYGSNELISNVFDLANLLDAELDQQGYFISIYKWLIITTDSVCEEFIDVISDVEHVLCFQFLQNAFRKRSMLLSKKEDANFLKPKTLLFGKSGRVFSTVHLSTKIRVESLFPNMRYNFNGKECRIGTQYWTPHMFIGLPGNTSSPQYGGFYNDVINLYVHVLNCTPVIVVASNCEWGRQLENGSWTGIVGQLQNMHVDLAIAPLTVTRDRAEAMDFADFPLQFSGVYGVYKSPGNIPFGVATVAKPFSAGVWSAVVIALFVYPLVIVVHAGMTHQWSQNSSDKQSRACRSVYIINMIKHITNCYTAQLHKTIAVSVTQSINLSPIRKLSLRCFWSAWILFALILVYIWSANITSYLTVIEKSEPISDFEDLLESDFKYGFTVGTPTGTFLKNSASKVHRQIYSNALKFRQKWPDLLNARNEMVLQGGYVFIAEEDECKTLVATYCDVMIMDEILYTARYAVGLHRNSAYKPLVNRVTLMLHESGIFDDLLKKLYSKLETCDREQEYQKISLGTQQLSGIFVCFGATIAGCAVVLLYELWCFRSRLRPQLKTVVVVVK